MKKNHFKQIDVSTEPQLFFRFDKMLESKKAMGTSRHKAKEDGTEKNKIFSYNTYNTYRNTLYDFSHFVLDRHPNVKQPNQARKYVDEFLQSYQDKGASNWTIKNKRSALAKVYGKDYSTIKIGQCKREYIKRSRKWVETDKHFSEAKNSELVNVCIHTGLRRSELEKLHGACVSQHDDGNWYVDHVKGKGGKIRDIRILNNDQRTIDLISNTSNDKLVFNNVPHNADIHAYRATYASELYNTLERNLKTLPTYAKYYCRDDLKGVVYDRQAMLEVSRNLGHNRINVIASNYLYRVK